MGEGSGNTQGQLPLDLKKAVQEYNRNYLDRHDAINHPPHYMAGGIETIDYIKAKLSKEEFIGYLKGNALKYLSRASFKGELVEDINKHCWYANKLVEVLQDGF